MRKLIFVVFTLYFLLYCSSCELIGLPYNPISISNIFGAIDAFTNNPSTVLQDASIASTLKSLHQIALKPEEFNDVSLSHQLPQYFLLNQIFHMKGKVNKTKLLKYFSTQPTNKTTYTVNAVFLSQQSGKQQVFSSRELQKEQIQFEIQCYFNHPDTYFMGIFVGQQAKFTPRVFQVRESVIGEEYISELQSQDLPPKPQNLTITVQDNQMIVKWAAISPLCRLIFSQNSAQPIQKQFLVSNDQGFIIIPYAAFKDFKKKQTQLTLQYAWSKDIGAFSRISRFSEPYRHKFNVTEHHFRVYRPDLIELNGIPSMVSLNTNLYLKGKSKQMLRQQAFIVQPDNQILERVIQRNTLNSKYIYPNQDFYFSEQINEEGVYFIQINHEKGWALLNTPIYAGSQYPLLPDYSDMYPYLKEISQFSSVSYNNNQITDRFQQQSTSTLEQERKLIFQLINQKRKEFDQEPVILDQELNRLAQAHSEEMAKNNYASHTNLDGLSANGRALKAGISTPVGEAIAVNEDIQFGQYRLARSPIHLKNIINSQWYRVGVGIAKSSKGTYYITENFSTKNPQKDKITDEQLHQYKLDIVEAVSRISKRSIKLNDKFSEDLNNWHEKDWNNQEGLKKLMAKYKAFRISYQKVSLTFAHNFIPLVEKEGYLRDRGFNNVAISLVINQLTLEIAMVFY